MNPVLRLKGNFSHSKAAGVPGAPSLSSGDSVKSNHILQLKRELEGIFSTWNGINDNPVISVYYEKTIAKTRRPKQLFSGNNKKSDEFIVGAKFWGPENKWHQIVYCVSKEMINSYIKDLEICAKIIYAQFDGEMTYEKLKSINSSEHRKKYSKLIESYGIKRTPFSQLIVDSSSIAHIGVDTDTVSLIGNSFVSLYKTDVSANKILELLNIPYDPNKIYDEQNLMLTQDEYDALRERAPYLIAMSCNDEIDLDELPLESKEFETSSLDGMPTIEKPNAEPIIGVIDTLFLDDSEKVYFTDWVSFEDYSDKMEPIDKDSYLHGTCVDSIIVDGPSLNPSLDDGCGKFRVKHFGITRARKLHLFRLVRQIRSIVKNNSDISVWNISLGSDAPISKYSISPLASILDDLQKEYNVIFVIAGTNRDINQGDEGGGYLRIGTPADSINSLVVNSVKSNNQPASYTRVGPVLGFFTKPDIAYYGGDKREPCTVWGLGKACYQVGTSFAAPWVSRKLAYLIEVKGFSCEAAKALLIDAASGWNPDTSSFLTNGHGIMPVRIEDIIGCDDDEIKFVITGKTELYQTYNYKLPIPIHQGKFPYTARATLCYFPKCTRAQGVDYTDTELDFRIGRIKNGKIDPINNDLQNDLKERITEKDARKNFRKWDNVKIISEATKNRKIPKRMYETSLWGIEITSKKRLENKDREDIRFGIVVTLKEMNKKNRLDAFTKACRANGWLVEEVTPEADVDFMALLEEDVEFDS